MIPGPNQWVRKPQTASECLPHVKSVEELGFFRHQKKMQVIVQTQLFEGVFSNTFKKFLKLKSEFKVKPINTAPQEIC